MTNSKFVYVTYIRTTPEKLWQALTDSSFTRRYFFGNKLESDWRAGSAWAMRSSENEVTDAGEVLESNPPRKLILKWRHELKPELRAEGFSRMTYEIEPMGNTVKLTLLHETDVTDSKVIEAVSKGWPMVLSGLKSLLETGETFELESPCTQAGH